MLKTLSPGLRIIILALLLPVLLLLPAFHAHPEHRHAHGRNSTHSHQAIIHADFFTGAAHEHAEHHEHEHEHGHGHGHEQSHGGSGESSSPSNFSPISFFTLIPRSLVLFTPALERALLALVTPPPVLTSRSLSQLWRRPSEHPPPVESASFPAISPRSPPHSV